MAGKTNEKANNNNTQKPKKAHKKSQPSHATDRPISILTHSKASSISARSIDDGPDSIKVSEMIDTSSGGLAKSWPPSVPDKLKEANPSDQSKSFVGLSKGQKKRLKARLTREKLQSSPSISATDVPLNMQDHAQAVPATSTNSSSTPDIAVGALQKESQSLNGASILDQAKQNKKADAQKSKKKKAPGLQTAQDALDSHDTGSASPRPPQNHRRHKSFDVRVRINGGQKSVQVDSPSLSPIVTAKGLNATSLTVKLPGQAVRVVRTDQSSGGDAQLESRLQHMILSHADDTSRPDAASDHKTNTLNRSQATGETNTEHLGAYAQQANSYQPRSYSHGPPSLPPPQPYNVPAQIPDYRDPYNANYAYGYYPMQNTYYPPTFYPQAYSPFPQQHYPMSQMYGASSDGVVYYSTDGQIVQNPYTSAPFSSYSEAFPPSQQQHHDFTPQQQQHYQH